MTVSERIKTFRKSLGLTQAEFGGRVGIVQGHLTGIESGKKSITEKTIKVISSVFSLSENWLRTGEGEMYVEVNSKADRFFDELSPEYQDFILLLIEDLLELQRKRSRN